MTNDYLTITTKKLSFSDTNNEPNDIKNNLRFRTIQLIQSERKFIVKRNKKRNNILLTYHQSETSK